MVRLVRLVGMMMVLLLWGGCTQLPAPTSTPLPTATPGATVTPIATATSAATATPGVATPTAPVGPPSVLVRVADDPTGAYRAIGRFQAASSCTAVFIRTASGSAARAAPAYVLTSGHCIRLMTPNEVLIDAAITARPVTFDYYVDHAGTRISRPIRRLAYATMTGTDLAVVELDDTVARLTDVGIRPMTLAANLPPPGTAIELVAAPTDNVPRTETYLRRSRCVLGATAEVIEHHWVWRGLVSNRCADVAGGSSGGPVLEASSGQVVAVLNTSTGDSDGLPDCALNRPCEVTATGRRVVPATNYAAPVAGLERCFGPDGRFNLAASGCPLSPTTPAGLASATPIPSMAPVRPVPQVTPTIRPNAIPTIDPATAELAGTTWQPSLLWSAAATPIAQSLPGSLGSAYVTFQADGTIVGFDSCNHFDAPYAIRPGRSLTIGTMEGTLMACLPIDIMQGAGRFILALDETASYQMEGEYMHLIDESGRRLMSLRQSSSLKPRP